MNEFKVGQRVHNNSEGYFCEIFSIRKEYCNVKNKEGNLVSVLLSDLHQTAQSMFEALGYEKSKPLAHIIKYRYKNDGYIFNIYFNMSKQIYSFEDNNKRILGVNLDVMLAIHQKLIELGWL